MKNLDDKKSFLGMGKKEDPEEAFANGKYYTILCRAGNVSLKIDVASKIEEENQKKYENSRIIAASPNATENDQIWMVQKVGEGN